MFTMKNALAKVLRFVAFVCLIACFALALSACGAKGDNAIDDVTTIEVSSESDIVFVGDVNAEDFDDQIKNGLTVEIVNKDGTRHSVEFTVKSKTVSDDGTQITIVVEAEGIEKTFVAAYKAQEKEPIIDELVPLYELLSGEGDKSFTLSFAAVKSEGEEEPDSMGFNVTVNLLENGSIEFMVVDEQKEETVVAYKDSLLYIDGLNTDLTYLKSQISAMIADVSDEAIEETDAEDGLYDAFLSAGQTLKMLETLADNPFLTQLGIAVSKEDGVYTIEANTQTLIPALKGLLESMSGEGFNYADIIDIIDGLTDGALTSGNVTFTATFGIDGLEATLTASIYDAETGKTHTVSADISASDQVADIEVPVAEEQTIEDISIGTYFWLPQTFNRLYVNVDAVLHTSDLLTGDFEGKNILTANVTYGETENAVVFVLNDHYVYLDLTGLANYLYEEDLEDRNFTFYQAFEIDGESVSFIRFLPQLFAETEYEYIVDDGDYEGSDDGYYDDGYVGSDDDYYGDGYVGSDDEYYGDDDMPLDEEESFDIMELVKYLRFVEITADDDLATVVSNAKENIEAIIAENEELFSNAVSLSLDDQLIITINVNNEEGNDLVAILNLFVGIPTEEGFANIDENMILGVLNQSEDGSAEIINAIFGTDLKTVLENLSIDIVIDLENGLSVDFLLYGESDYIGTGFYVKPIENADQFDITDDMIEGANPFDELGGTLMELSSMLMGKIFYSEPVIEG